MLMEEKNIIKRNIINNKDKKNKCIYNYLKILQKESCNNKLQKNQNFIENRE